MSKIVQHLGRISRIRRCVITTTLLSALVLVPAVVVVSMMFVTPLTQAQSQPSAKYSLKVLHNFNGTDGSSPYSSPIRDAKGNLYGTAGFGGAYGYGVVFKVRVKGTETVLHSFSGSDGAYPLGPLLQDASGNFYGTTYAGGAYGYGEVFNIDTKGTFTVLYAFTFSNGDGAVAGPGLVQDSAGNLYGTTVGGGDLNCGISTGYGCGTVFKLDPTGNETVLYSFTGADGDGAFPFTTLAMDSAGYLYGTTNQGGDYSGVCGNANGCGTVWKLDTTTGKETVLHRFTASHGDGALPNTGGYIDIHGNFYGTTLYGGALQQCPDFYIPGCGIVFRIDTTGKYAVLHKFRGSPSDGTIPSGPLIQDEKGNFYGVTTFGGTYGGRGGGLGAGTVFKMSTSDNKHFRVTTLFSFTDDGGEEPSNPVSVIRDAHGSLYGFSSGGGWRVGAVFKLTPR